MNTIEIKGLDKSYGTTPILRGIDLNIRQGSFVALVGPSGCGKSTLLRTIAGLESITAGTLSIDGKVVNDTPPRDRDVAMVFQSYALYPHMDVARNMSYSLRLKKAAASVIDSALEGVANTLGLKPLLQRMPRELSGGQRQRVAMGRAIVRQPKVFLFDEPLSNLDAALRVHMRSEIRKLHQRLKATSVYVTHDQIEAMTMADQVVVMRAGHIEQVGTPLELYDTPNNRFVGGFIGSPAMNFVPGVVANDGQAVAITGTDCLLPLDRARPSSRPVWVGLRPEHLTIQQGSRLLGRVDTVESTGSMTFITFELAGALVTLAQTGRVSLAVGDQVPLGIAPAQTHIFDHTTEAAL
ncbi:MAG: sn-glycerol-3-phosphate ABC transporter ATP-binding protein UgpC [Rhodoferax sp.]|uniref:ABC transporter ATP-binding protein n=1 Tax=Rhodoferax sp. TaxID=50421 RepID=UPI00326790D5